MEHDYPMPVLRNKKKCQHLSLDMNCHVGGIGTANCFHESYHKTCRYKVKVEKLRMKNA